MSSYYVEHWSSAQSPTTVADEIARHLQVRQSLGSAIVLTERPVIFLSNVRKQWIKLYKALQIERARTLNASLRAALAHEITLMEQLKFSAKPSSIAKADVFFIEPDQISSQMPQEYCTIYTDSSMVAQANELLAQVCSGGVIVHYELASK